MSDVDVIPSPVSQHNRHVFDFISICNMQQSPRSNTSSTSHTRNTYCNRNGFNIAQLKLSPTTSIKLKSPKNLSLHNISDSVVTYTAPNSTRSESPDFDIQPVYNADVGERRPSFSTLSRRSTISLHDITNNRPPNITLPSNKPNLFLRTTASPIDSARCSSSDHTQIPVCPTQPDNTAQRQSKLNYFANDCTEILPNLFVGGKNVACNLQLLQSKGITHIVNCCGSVCDNMFTEYFTYCKLYLLDSTNEDILCILYPILAFIQHAISQNGKVLVHCHQGVSRSCVLCIAHIMYSTNCDYDEAYSIVRQHRGICRPNVGFMVQLMSWRKRITNTSNRPFCLYRIAAHCAHDRRVVAKWCDRIDVSSIDSRGMYVLTTHDTVIIWIGTLCQQNEALYMQRARELIATLQHLEHVGSEVAVVHQSDELIALQHVLPYSGRAFGLCDNSPSSTTHSTDDTPLHTRTGSLQLRDTQLLTPTQPCNMPTESQCYDISCASVPVPYKSAIDFQCFARVSYYFWQIMGGSHMQIHRNASYDTDYETTIPVDTTLIGNISYDILCKPSGVYTNYRSRHNSTFSDSSISPSPILPTDSLYDITINSPSTKRKQHIRDTSGSQSDDYFHDDIVTQPILFHSTSRRSSLKYLSRRSSTTGSYHAEQEEEQANVLRSKLMRITLNTDIGCGSPSLDYRKRLSQNQFSTPSTLTRNSTTITVSPVQYSNDTNQSAWLYRVNGALFERIDTYSAATLQHDQAYCLVTLNGSTDVYIHVWIGTAYKPLDNDHRFRSQTPHHTVGYDQESDDVYDCSLDSIDDTVVDMESAAQAIGTQLSGKLRLDELNNHITVERDSNESTQFINLLNNQ